MAKQKYLLNKGERIIYKEKNMRHGFWGIYTNTLAVTNQAVILEKYGLVNNFQGIIRYPLDEINQVLIGESFNGEKQLELYFDDKTEKFAPHSNDDIVLKTLLMAITDQMSSDAEYYDYNYYQGIIDGSASTEKEIRQFMSSNNNINDSDVQSGISFAGSVAKNVLKSGDISLKGVQKGINKANKKQMKENIFGGIKDEFMEDIGVREIQDSFTEIGNEFREMFGIKPKMTHEERRKMEEKELKRIKNEAYNRQVKIARQELYERKANSTIGDSNNKKLATKMSINEQIDALKNLKELMDAGVLTQEEFDKKKKEIMNL
jgi:hypothetical protein